MTVRSLFPAALLLVWVCGMSTGQAVFNETLAITGGRIYAVSAPVIENGTLLIADGKISGVGVNIPIPANALRIDARGKWVTPGLINAATQLGVVEIGQVRETNDETALGREAVSAAFRAWDGLNPESVLWSPTRNEGITSVVVLPTGGLIAGQAALADLADGPRSQVIRRAPIAMAAQLDNVAAGGAKARGELVMRLRELLDDTRQYAKKRASYEKGESRGFATGRLQLEALIPVVEGRLPLMLTVNRAADIETALDLAAEFKLKLIVIGGAEAWKLAERLAAAKVPVVTTALDNIPSNFNTLGARQENAALLRKAGVPVVITADPGEFFNVRNIRQHAGNAVAYGLPWDEALRAVTLAPAEAFGLASEIGSLRVGAAANVVVWNGDPFEFATRADRVFIRGRDLKGLSRQDLLIERYKQGGR